MKLKKNEYGANNQYNMLLFDEKQNAKINCPLPSDDDTSCGSWCAMFEIRDGHIRGTRNDCPTKVILHCCKREIMIDEEVKP